jgi:DNA-directed RNA polymerase subunit RPC12/RpoP
MGVFGKLFTKSAGPGVCQRCGKPALRSAEFFAKCEEAGLVVDRATGEVKARLGGFSMFGTPMDASSQIAGQRKTQQEIVESIENQRGFRCTGCGRVYCMECLFNHAPPHAGGGKACPKCGAVFVVFE